MPDPPFFSLARNISFSLFMHGRIYGRKALDGSCDWSFLAERVDNVCHCSWLITADSIFFFFPHAVTPCHVYVLLPAGPYLRCYLHPPTSCLSRGMQLQQHLQIWIVNDTFTKKARHLKVAACKVLRVLPDLLQKVCLLGL